MASETTDYFRIKSDRQLVEIAVGNCRSSEYRKGHKHPRWVAVAGFFSLGSTAANNLCAEFGFDPDEKVSR